jgi:hypothetical protein
MAFLSFLFPLPRISYQPFPAICEKEKAVCKYPAIRLEILCLDIYQFHQKLTLKLTLKLLT